MDDDDCYNPNMEGITQDDPTVDEQTQRADKRPMEEPTTKGKKVTKKNDRASEMTMALQEYIALARERFSKKRESLMVALIMLHNLPMVAILTRLGELKKCGTSIMILMMTLILTSPRLSKRKRKRCCSWACLSKGGGGGL